VTSVPAATVLDQVCDLVRDVARREVMSRFLQARRQIKSDGSVFSEADLAAEQALSAELPCLIRAPVIGEEMPRSAQIRAWETGDDGVWCIDPIDGSTNFINGLPFFAVSVAFLRAGQPLLGVTYNPVTDELFSARADSGAFLNGQPLPLRQPTDDITRAVAAVDFKRIPRALADRIAIAPPFYSQRNFGASTLEWCYLAAGRIDVYLHGGQRLWDYAAGRLILAEAGGQCCSLADNNFDAGDPWRRSALAALDPTVFSAWRDWVRQPET
jgi:myo-inositol-1(or 4)-monophosphatase